MAGFLFTCIVMLSSFLTTFFITLFEEPSYYGLGSYGLFFVSPVTLARDLVAAAFRILREEDLTGVFKENMNFSEQGRFDIPLQEPKFTQTTLVRRFIRRFILGLPMVGAGSLVQMLLSAPLLGPLQWLARQRGARRRRDNSRDLAAAVIITLLVVGTLR
jgi:hypothetical protein